jgi:Zn-finger nucleic acid-binding protein
MQCPIDGTNLVITDRAGVEIDYCPQCRGVWLDRGELDKILDRAANQPAPRSDDHDHDPRPRDGYRKKKSGGFLGELFDF